MVQDFLQLRNKLHEDEFRFDLSLELWEASYTGKPSVGADDIVEVKRDGRLVGYAICSLSDFAEGMKSYQVLEFNAVDKEVMKQVVEQINTRAAEKGADLIVLSKFQERYNNLLAQYDFVDCTSYAVLAAVLDPAGLLRTLATEGTKGRRLNIIVAGYDAVSLTVGHNAFSMADNSYQPDVTATMSDKTFISIFFGKTTVAREFLRGTIRIDGLMHFGTVMQFFAMIRQNKLYIPPGDGI